ncbi:60S acidic ribosomal protein P1-like isoform X1 [Limulus polyphemus]|uniref:Large ribosomal subunit protein P1 n=1 Tax=Limulus polyphemus TaxID=6850 RepID=A0ABM1BB61_LIMPO|nr:60S acidic ribosomal protein P1-like isoform X1 [Limulus polyphemus]
MATDDELACVYSALILQDDEVTITSEKINTILKAANMTVEPYWPGLFTKALEGMDLKQLITNVGSGVGAAPTGGDPGAKGTAPAKATKEVKKEEKHEESEEENVCMCFGMFD